VLSEGSAVPTKTLGYSPNTPPDFENNLDKQYKTFTFFSEKGKTKKQASCHPSKQGEHEPRLKRVKGQVVFFRRPLKNLHLKPLTLFILSVAAYVPIAVPSKHR
jgi:hypothetical protein